jgi:hypothetical protein
LVLWGGDAGDDKLVVTFPLSLNMSKEAIYRAIVRFASLRKGHDAEGKCDASCPCHDDPMVHKVAARFQQVYFPQGRR